MASVFDAFLTQTDTNHAEHRRALAEEAPKVPVPKTHHHHRIVGIVIDISISISVGIIIIIIIIIIIKKMVGTANTNDVGPPPTRPSGMRAVLQ